MSPIYGSPDIHMIGTPTAVASTAGAGIGPPAVTVTGNDRGFHCSFTSGASGEGASATIFTVTFAAPFAVAPSVVGPIPGNVATAQAQAATKAAFANTITTTGFIFTSGVALTAGTLYDYAFTVHGL